MRLDLCCLAVVLVASVASAGQKKSPSPGQKKPAKNKDEQKQKHESAWETFTYDFGAWSDEQQLALIMPQGSGDCSLMLQYDVDPAASTMVFPYCVRNKPPSTVDFRSGVDKVFDHIVMDDSACAASGTDVNNPLCVKGKNIGKNTLILEDFFPDLEDPTNDWVVRARTAYRLTENGKMLLTPSDVLGLKPDTWGPYPHPSFYDVGQALRDDSGNAAYVYTNQGHAAKAQV